MVDLLQLVGQLEANGKQIQVHLYSRLTLEEYTNVILQLMQSITALLQTMVVGLEMVEF